MLGLSNGTKIGPHLLESIVKPPGLAEEDELHRMLFKKIQFRPQSQRIQGLNFSDVQRNYGFLAEVTCRSNVDHL